MSKSNELSQLQFNVNARFLLDMRTLFLKCAWVDAVSTHEEGILLACCQYKSAVLDIVRRLPKDIMRTDWFSGDPWLQDPLQSYAVLPMNDCALLFVLCALTCEDFVEQGTGCIWRIVHEVVL